MISRHPIILKRLARTALQLLLCALLAFTAAGQNASPEMQAAAIRKYPDLGILNTPFNKSFLEVYHQRRATDPAFFDDPQWPVLLADEIARASAKTAPEPPRNTTLPSPPPRQVRPSPPPAKPATGAATFTFLMVSGVLLCGGLLTALYFVERTYRRKRLVAKYQDPHLVNLMMQRQPWRGETVEQLVESLGRPVEVDQQILETRLQETWNYDPIARDRYQLRVTIENGRVVGWETRKRVSAIKFGFKAVRSHFSRESRDSRARRRTLG